MQMQFKARMTERHTKEMWLCLFWVADKTGIHRNVLYAHFLVIIYRYSLFFERVSDHNISKYE